MEKGRLFTTGLFFAAGKDALQVNLDPFIMK